MSKPELIPSRDLGQERANPMIWEGEEQAEGVFLDTGEALDLLGVPALQVPPEPRLPLDYTPGPDLRAALAQLRHSLASAAAGEVDGRRIDVTALQPQSRQAVLEMLGEGEVSGFVVLDGVRYTVTESVLPGVWRVAGTDDSEWLEVGPVPAVITEAAGSLRAAPFTLPPAGPGIMNGLAVLAEISEHAAAWDGTAAANRVLNFTLLPMSPEDQQLLIDVLGRAELVLDSGGFGNCRIMATHVRDVWAVQYVNAMGNTILDTIEVGRIPEAAVAASQDLQDSARRLDDILDTYLS